MKHILYFLKGVKESHQKVTKYPGWEYSSTYDMGRTLAQRATRRNPS